MHSGNQQPGYSLYHQARDAWNAVACVGPPSQQLMQETNAHLLLHIHPLHCLQSIIRDTNVVDSSCNKPN